MTRYIALFLLAPFYGLLLAATPEPVSPTDITSTAITRLLLRDYEILISTSADGLSRYSIYSQSGQILATDLTDTQLQAHYPGLYDQLQPAIAGESEGPLMMMWAEPTQ